MAAVTVPGGASGVRSSPHKEQRLRGTAPSFLNAGRSLGSLSTFMLVTPSSVSTTVSPRRPLTVKGTSSFLKRPPCAEEGGCDALHVPGPGHRCCPVYLRSSSGALVRLRRVRVLVLAAEAVLLRADLAAVALPRPTHKHARQQVLGNGSTPLPHPAAAAAAAASPCAGRCTRPRGRRGSGRPAAGRARSAARSGRWGRSRERWTCSRSRRPP